MSSRPAPLLRRLFLRWRLSLYPPYLGAGIRVVEVAPDLRAIEVRMGLHFWNRNYVGTQFGGSLYSMVDPFYMLMLMYRLGPGYVVWDKAASVRFRRPGRGPVRARLEIPEEREEEIRRSADAGGKVEPVFVCQVRDEAGEVVAEVEKTLHVRRKEPASR
ncbi:MAG TPA: DUF4442 domain-containing protein [Anaeromyxobacteraceae bacterium]|nr:DUF4442 domain-containing protein [Anaeromyxobacteraceae bacterium]